MEGRPRQLRNFRGMRMEEATALNMRGGPGSQEEAHSPSEGVSQVVELALNKRDYTAGRSTDLPHCRGQ